MGRAPQCFISRDAGPAPGSGERDAGRGEVGGAGGGGGGLPGSCRAAGPGRVSSPPGLTRSVQREKSQGSHGLSAPTNCENTRPRAILAAITVPRISTPLYLQIHMDET